MKLCDFNGNNECPCSDQFREICDFRDGIYCYYSKEYKNTNKE